MRRTPDVQLDQDFEYVGEIVKSYVDADTGKRYIVGAATGLEEDQDGERVSKRAIANMVNAIKQGGVKVVGGSHEQNWLTECGEAVDAHVDPKTDQLMVKTELPPEGVDPVADKAWVETHKRKMAWSVGGKLRNAYHELTDTGKKRKVLDLVDLRHLCLTDKPAYQHSFAHAVAKTWDGEEPKDDEFTEEVEKDLTTGSQGSGDSGNNGQDSATGNQRNAGTRKKGAKGADVQDDKTSSNDDDDQGLEPASRHLSCPNCGHEFAADIPVDMTPEQRESNDQTGSSTTGKSEEDTMDLTKRIEALEDAVAKFLDTPEALETTAGKAETPAGESTVEKTTTDRSEVVKVVAIATGELDEKLEKTRTDLSEGFEILGRVVKDIRDTVGALPQGRKSTARVLPPATGHEDIEKTTEDETIEKSEDPLEVLKALNAKNYGIRA